MRIDCHHHFWKYDPRELDWMGPGMETIRRDFFPEDLEPLLDSIDFDGAITVEARQLLKESDFLLELADKHDIVKGVVGWVDLRSPDVRDQLEKYAQHPKFCGVRHVLMDEPDREFMLHADFQRGIGYLAEFGLTYDLLILYHHLPTAIELVQKHPGQSFVVDHIGQPTIKEKMVSPWKEDLAKLARFDNVYCKLSGMVECAEWKNWKPEDFTPYLDAVIELFGTDRVMIGSNWPVCTLSGAFKPVMDIVINYIRQFPEETRERILGGNCARFYGVPE